MTACTKLGAELAGRLKRNAVVLTKPCTFDFHILSCRNTRLPSPLPITASADHVSGFMFENIRTLSERTSHYLGIIKQTHTKKRRNCFAAAPLRPFFTTSRQKQRLFTTP